jgi:uncharacterized protein HemX
VSEPNSRSQTSTRTEDDHSTSSPKAQVHIVYAMSETIQAILVLGVILAIGLGTYGAVKGSIAERESRLQRLEVDEMKVALQVQGIKVHEGSTP